MKRTTCAALLILIVLALSVQVSAQYLSLPESIVFDEPRNRYLVSNWGSGHLVRIDSMGTQSYWLTNQQCFAGLHIQEGVLWVACREYGVKGFDLETGDNVLNLYIPATNINDITADTSGFLYVSYPTESRIYKVDVHNDTFWVYAEDGLDTPNGLYFEEETNRLLIISYRFNSPVQAIDLADSTLYTVTSTTLDELDGLTRDSDGNYYVSSWNTNACYRFDPDFADPPEFFSAHNDDPADISINHRDDLLCVPLFFTSNVEFVSVPLHAGDRISPTLQETSFLYPNYPNPFNSETVIPFRLSNSDNVTLSIYDINGREIIGSLNRRLLAGNHEIAFDASTLPSGTYIIRLSTGDLVQTQKMVILK